MPEAQRGVSQLADEIMTTEELFNVTQGEFKPTHYARLIKRSARINYLEYHLTLEGIDQPNATIVPIMVIPQQNGSEIAWLIFDNKLQCARFSPFITSVSKDMRDKIQVLIVDH